MGGCTKKTKKKNTVVNNNKKKKHTHAYDHPTEFIVVKLIGFKTLQHVNTYSILYAHIIRYL